MNPYHLSIAHPLGWLEKEDSRQAVAEALTSADWQDALRAPGGEHVFLEFLTNSRSTKLGMPRCRRKFMELLVRAGLELPSPQEVAGALASELTGTQADHWGWALLEASREVGAQVWNEARLLGSLHDAWAETKFQDERGMNAILQEEGLSWESPLWGMSVRGAWLLTCLEGFSQGYAQWVFRPVPGYQMTEADRQKARQTLEKGVENWDVSPHPDRALLWSMLWFIVKDREQWPGGAQFKKSCEEGLRVLLKNPHPVVRRILPLCLKEEWLESWANGAFFYWGEQSTETLWANVWKALEGLEHTAPVTTSTIEWLVLVENDHGPTPPSVLARVPVHTAQSLLAVRLVQHTDAPEQPQWEEELRELGKLPGARPFQEAVGWALSCACLSPKSLCAQRYEQLRLESRLAPGTTEKAKIRM